MLGFCAMYAAPLPGLGTPEATRCGFRARFFGQRHTFGGSDTSDQNRNYQYNIEFLIEPVPEPMTMLTMTVLGGIAIGRRRR